MATLGVLLLDGCHFPTRNADTLQSIRNEARVLIARSKKYGEVPKHDWPTTIASLEPDSVSVDDEGVDILTQRDFDGGWGYLIVRNEKQQPDPEGQYSRLAPGIYWYHPY